MSEPTLPDQPALLAWLRTVMDGQAVDGNDDVATAVTPLLVLEAGVHLRGEHSERVLTLDRFLRAIEAGSIVDGELLVGIDVPALDPEWTFANYAPTAPEPGPRAAFAVEIVQDLVADARIAYAGLSAMPALAETTETALIGLPWSAASIETALLALPADFGMAAPESLQAAADLLRRFHCDHEAVSVT